VVQGHEGVQGVRLDGARGVPSRCRLVHPRDLRQRHLHREEGITGTQAAPFAVSYTSL